MTENEFDVRYDFLSEKRLHKLDDGLFRLFRNSVFSIDLLLTNYKNIFPFYTDHTFEHSEQVIRYCNIVAGADILDALCADELYILLMGASLHDIGMGISEKDFRELSPRVAGMTDYMAAHPGEQLAEYARAFHQELSGQFIRKYSALFEIPTPEHIHCIAQVARGHRKADLLDKTEYPTDYPLPNGQRVNLAYLAALVKLADELDITADRNLLFDYNDLKAEWSEKQTMCYKCHGAIKSLGVRSDALVLYYDTDEPKVEEEILKTRGKVERTFAEYCEVVRERSSFQNRLHSVLFEQIRP